MPEANDAAAARVETILAHPRFPEARQAYIDSYLAIYSGDPGLNKLLAEGSRHVIITFVMCLSAASREDDPATWLTLSKLQDIVVAHQVGSPGLVETIVNRMLDRGLLSSTPSPHDRRMRILAPTPALTAHDRDLIMAQGRACAVVTPSTAVTRAAECDPAIHSALRIASAAAFGEAMAMLMRNAGIMLFIERDSGLMALYAMLSSARQSADGRLSTLSYQEIADRFGVSRTHIRDMVAEAEAAGLMRARAAGGAAVELLAPLDATVDRFIADAMGLFADCCERAALIADGNKSAGA